MSFPYTPAEIALGRGIGSQLALEADRLARAVQDGTMGAGAPGATGAVTSDASRGLAAEIGRAVERARDAHVEAPGAAPAVAVTVQGTPRPLSADVELELLRITQAALANALRHAHARHVRVALAFPPDGADASAGGVRITITDDGVGFDPDVPRPGRFGVVGMGERAARVGARLTIVTAPGEGTEVVAMWRPPGGA